MSLSTWIEFSAAIGPGPRAQIISLLEDANICICASGDTQTRHGGSPGVVVFDAVDERALSMVHGTSGGMGVLALSVAAEPIASPALWSLIHAGALDVVQWPCLPAAADDVACRLRRWSSVAEMLDSPRVRESLVGTSPAWRRFVRGVVEMAAFTSSSVLITGESGTGKELIAQMIHDLDPRREKGDFVVVDCTTVSPELSGSEFFGHDRGAFTGAMSARDGAFALADNGTLFLDEVGELSPALQAQLLRAVQEHKYKRVGSNTWQTTHFRLLSATNRNLERCIAEGSFRGDFYYRIAGWHCRTVSLRDRKEDILPLSRHFVRQLLPPGDAVPIDPAVQEFLLTRDYPGNVRDLRQLVTRICHRHVGSGPITIGDIPEDDRLDCGCTPRPWPESSFRSAVRVAVEMGIGMKDIGQTATELAIELALEREDGNLQRAAARLGVTDRALQIRRASQREASASSAVS
jgi:transcriptional regulator with GAF, ATPase, and Fis domain